MPYKDLEALKQYKREYYQKNKESYKRSSAKSKKKRRPKKREFSKRYKLFCGCRRCGYDKAANALEYHHIDPSEKDSTVSRLIAGNWGLETIKKEIRKCVVLCANCHREVHEEIEQGVEHEWFLDTSTSINSKQR
jgi:transcription elongation factor Elf1